MPPDHGAHFAEAERAELERVVQALAKWPRLSHLLLFMGEKLSSGEVDQLNEYNIATEVLGRSKTVFNAGEDAIARVETHRLRKRLAEFYQREGKDHPIQVTLPAGSYVPIFIHKSEGVSPQAAQDVSLLPASDFHLDGSRPLPWIVWSWKYLALAAAIAIAALGAYLYFRDFRARSSGSAKSTVNPVLIAVPSSAISQAFSGPVRLLAGYSGSPRTDSAGRIWNPDQNFSAGGSWQRTPEFLARTSDPFIFEHSRTGDFSYRIPLKPGSYEVHLFFSTPVRSSEGVATFSGWINDEQILNGFDINLDAMGENIADERVFRDFSPDKDGVLRIAFAGATAPPALNAIEILSGVPHAQLPVRLIMQTTPFTDHKGQFWRPDNYFMNGRLHPQVNPLIGSADPDLFRG